MATVTLTLTDNEEGKPTLTVTADTTEPTGALVLAALAVYQMTPFVRSVNEGSTPIPPYAEAVQQLLAKEGDGRRPAGRSD